MQLNQARHLPPPQVLFGCVEEVLKATGPKPQAVDILIVNCSLFNPTPSLSGARLAWWP